MGTIEAAITAYEEEKGKGTIEEITKFRELLVLVDENTTRLFRLQEEKLLHLFDLLLEQVFRGSQFEHRVVEMFAKFIERGKLTLFQFYHQKYQFRCNTESLIKALKKTKLVRLQFGRRYIDMSNPQQAKKEKYFHNFLNVRTRQPPPLHLFLFSGVARNLTWLHSSANTSHSMNCSPMMTRTLNFLKTFEVTWPLFHLRLKVCS